MATRSERLEKLAARQHKLQEQERKLQARIAQLRAADSREERKLDTRRKILIGSMVLAAVESGQRSRDDLLRELGAYLTEDRDRSLFGLAAQGSESEQTASAEPPRRAAKPALEAHA